MDANTEWEDQEIIGTSVDTARNPEQGVAAADIHEDTNVLPERNPDEGDAAEDVDASMNDNNVTDDEFAPPIDSGIVKKLLRFYILDYCYKKIISNGRVTYNTRIIKVM